MSEIFYKFAKKIGLLKILGKKYVINKKFIKKMFLSCNKSNKR